MKRLPIRLAHTLALALGMLASLTPPAWAAPPGVVSDLFLPFSGTVFNAHTGEDVMLSGELHVTALFSPSHTFVRAIIRRVDEASGVTTGDTYDITTPIDPFLPPDPATPPYPIRGEFRRSYFLWPPDPISPPFLPPNPIRIFLFFTADGGLLNGSVTI